MVLHLLLKIDRSKKAGENGLGRRKRKSRWVVRWRRVYARNTGGLVSPEIQDERGQEKARLEKGNGARPRAGPANAGHLAETRREASLLG